MIHHWKAQHVNVETGEALGAPFDVTGSDKSEAAKAAARKIEPGSSATSDSTGQWRVMRGGRLWHQINIKKATRSRRSIAAPKGPKFTLTRIPLDRGGYTKGKHPRYYGTGAPLWSVEVDWDDLEEQLVALGHGRDLFKRDPKKWPDVLKQEGANEQAMRVWKIEREDGSEFRAADRDAAKNEIRKRFPDARF